jgi:hypothetical protein
LGEYVGTPRTSTDNNNIHNCYGNFDKWIYYVVLLA